MVGRVAIKRPRCKVFACLLTTAFAAANAADRPLTRFEFAQPLMGTMFKIVLYASDPTVAAQSANAAFDRIAALDNTMSDYNPESELIRLCQRAGGPPVNVSEGLFQVLDAAQQLATRSDGAFDITVGPVVRLWRRARRRHELPDPDRLATALALVGYHNLVLDPRQRTAQLLKPGMLLDLGGIGKGYAADEALAVLKEDGIRSALVAAAGDIACGNPPPGHGGWRIEIALPEPSTMSSDKSARYLLLHDAAVSTSGDAEQHLDVGGQRYSHIINPATGIALTGRRSVTVVAPRGITADSYATAVCVLGPQRGLELIDATEGASALIVEASGQRLQYFESQRPLPYGN